MKKYKINVMKWNLEKYNSTPLFYQKFQILLLMENANTHLVSIFKDYLLYDDMTEFFKEYYDSKEIYPRLKTIYDYYESSSYLFPNYTAINEGKYIYRNIIKKQKLIDYLEDLEDKKKEKEEKINLKKKKKYQNQNDQSSSSFIEVFDTKVYDNIRKETWNDSKINDLFCVENKNSNDCDSFASLIKLAEMIKDKDKEKEKEKIKETKYVKKNIVTDKDKDNNDKSKLKKNKEFNNINNSNNKNSNINDITKKEINKINNNIIINKDNYLKNAKIGLDNKIYVSRRINIKQNINNKICQKRPETNININDFINNNYSTNTNIYTNKNISINFNTNINTNIKSITHNWSNRNKIINTEPSKSNDFAKNSKGKLIQKNQVNSSHKNTYKKNNIIINIINNNKNNNYNTNNNYFSSYTSNNVNTNENNAKNNNYNNFQINNNYFPNYTNINEKISINNDNLNNINNLNIISNNNNSTKNNPKIKININTNNINNNKIKGQISSKGLTVKNTINNNNTSNNKSIIKKSKNEIKSKLLSFRLTTDILSTETNLIRNLTERIRKQSQSNSKKKAKEQQKAKNIFSPKKNMKKRTKSEIMGTKSDIFLFGQQNEINTYNKSINRQILKNINLTNVNKQKKEISLINKKIINSHFNINNNSKNKIKHKYIKHSSTNSQNLTSIGIINKIIPLQFKDLTKKKGAVFSVNKTERSSRNHSKETKNKTIIKRNFKDSFSPKKSQDLIHNKIHKIQNKNTNIIICSFLKNVNSNQKIKNLKIKRKSNNYNYKSININSKNKEAYNRINKDKNI